MSCSVVVIRIVSIRTPAPQRNRSATAYRTRRYITCRKITLRNSFRLQDRGHCQIQASARGLGTLDSRSKCMHYAIPGNRFQKYLRCGAVEKHNSPTWTGIGFSIAALLDPACLPRIKVERCVQLLQERNAHLCGSFDSSPFLVRFWGPGLAVRQYPQTSINHVQPTSTSHPLVPPSAVVLPDSVLFANPFY
jgi:hypothetical protein